MNILNSVFKKSKGMIFIVKKVSELAVIEKTKILCDLIMTSTEKSPKRFRFSIVAKLHAYSLNALENLYRANDVWMKIDLKNGIKERLRFQYKAFTELNLLDYIAYLAKQRNCILDKEYVKITEQIFICKSLLGGWVKSERNKLKGLN